MAYVTKDTAPIIFGRVAPTIPVSDINKALEFYCGLLGFERTFENGNPVGFVILQRDSAEIHLTLVVNYKATDRNVAHLLLSDVATFHSLLSTNGVRIIKGLREVVPGMQGFVFADPDGNRIDVGSMRLAHTVSSAL